MMVRQTVLAAGLGLIATTLGWGQALPSYATIESIPLELTMPERYQVTAVLEPVRRVAIMAPADGIVRSVTATIGMAVRSSQEIAQLDRAGALSRLKAAQAEVKEKQALIKTAASAEAQDVFKAQLEAAEARAELAQLDLDRLSLQAPFAGRISALPVSSGQYVLKGTTIAELVDVSSLKALVPVDRRTAAEGADLKIAVEEQDQSAKVQSIMPLPESFASLRSLAAPFAAAWISVANDKGQLGPGLRVRSATLPITPLATIPRESVKQAESTTASPASFVQVIRNEYVTNIPVDILGKIGPERIQVSGPLRSTDALIVSCSVPLLPGTLVRFAQSPGQAIEGTTPSPDRRGSEAGITPPARTPGSGVGGATTGAPRTRSSAPATTRPTRRPPAAGQGQAQPTPF